jgi:hypothetical protein
VKVTKGIQDKVPLKTVAEKDIWTEGGREVTGNLIINVKI